MFFCDCVLTVTYCCYKGLKMKGVKLPIITVNSTDEDIPNGRFKVKLIGLELDSNITHTNTVVTVLDSDGTIVESVSNPGNLLEILMTKNKYNIGNFYNISVTLTLNKDGEEIDIELPKLPMVGDDTLSILDKDKIPNIFKDGLTQNEEKTIKSMSKTMDMIIAAAIVGNQDTQNVLDMDFDQVEQLVKDIFTELNDRGFDVKEYVNSNF